jgi:TonB family protein
MKKEKHPGLLCLFAIALVAIVIGSSFKSTSNKTLNNNDLQLRDTITEVVDITEVKGVTEEQDDAIFIVVEENATFQDGDVRSFVDWMSKNMVYPQEAKVNGVSGVVIAQFIINPEGKLIKPTIARGVEKSLNNEVLRLLNLSPLWKPGKQGGKAINQQYTIPVRFSYPEN